MPKRIESPVKRFPGYVVLHDPLTYPQVIAYQDAVLEVVEMGETTWNKIRHRVLGGILPCVEEWHIEGVPDMPSPDTFPATPQVSAGRLIEWLQNNITELLKDEEDIPNG